MTGDVNHFVVQGCAAAAGSRFIMPRRTLQPNCIKLLQSLCIKLQHTQEKTGGGTHGPAAR